MTGCSLVLAMIEVDLVLRGIKIKYKRRANKRSLACLDGSFPISFRLALLGPLILNNSGSAVYQAYIVGSGLLAFDL